MSYAVTQEQQGGGVVVMLPSSLALCLVSGRHLMNQKPGMEQVEDRESRGSVVAEGM